MLSTRQSSTQETVALLNCRRLPARLNVMETAVLLGFREHDIASLVVAKLLNPLGKPAANAPKYFASVEIVARSENPTWLAEATKAIARHWKTKNEGKRANRRIGKHASEANPTTL